MSGRSGRPTVEWQRWDVSDWELAGEEVQGRNPHRWLRNDGQSRTWLFKPHEGDRSRPLGEDVTELVVSSIARAMRVPAARVQLAMRAGVPGCIVEDLRWPEGEDFAGRVVLDHHEGYDPDHPGRRGHTVTNIRRALHGFGPPPGSSGTAHFTGFDVFVGFLVLDALVANTDRHDRNWSVLVPPAGTSEPPCLCASYDHGSSLAFNLSDDRRTLVLEGDRMAAFAGRAHARQFQHVPGERRLSLVDLVGEATGLVDTSVAAHWREGVRGLDLDGLEGELSRGPLTPMSRRFTIALLRENRRRLLDALR